MEYGVHSTRYTRLSDEQLYSMYRETAYSQLKEEEKLELIQETVNRDAMERGEIGSPEVRFIDLPVNESGNSIDGVININRDMAVYGVQNYEYKGHVIHHNIDDYNIQTLNTAIREVTIMKKFNTKHAIKNNFVSTEEREGVLINRVKLSKQRHKKLDKGKGKKVGFIESIVLKIAGYCDGRKGLPRQTDDNAWYSPFMSRDVNSYEEFCSHIWGSLQIENEVAYAKLEELMDKILQERGLINTAKSKLEIAYNFEKELELSRKKGEDKLTDAQIYARRKAEKDKKLVALKKNVARLEQELKEVEDTFSELHSKLVEDDNTTRLICYRVKNHILMRIDIYWNSVLRHHPDNACMPVLPILEIKDDAEEVYLRQHKELMKRATTFHDLIQDEATKKEVA